MRAHVAVALGAGALATLVGNPIAILGKPAARSAEARAAQAAVAATHGGKVVDVVRENEAGATWEVEVLLSGDRKVDVLLDAKLHAIDVSDEREPIEIGSDRKGTSPASQSSVSRGRQAHRAAQAAAKAVGGGILMDVDGASEKGATWEVEFLKLDGSRVSVLLDDDLHVIRTERGKRAR